MASETNILAFIQRTEAIMAQALATHVERVQSKLDADSEYMMKPIDLAVFKELRRSNKEMAMTTTGFKATDVFVTMAEEMRQHIQAEASESAPKPEAPEIPEPAPISGAQPIDHGLAKAPLNPPSSPPLSRRDRRELEQSKRRQAKKASKRPVGQKV